MINQKKNIYSLLYSIQNLLINKNITIYIVHSYQMKKINKNIMSKNKFATVLTLNYKEHSEIFISCYTIKKMYKIKEINILKEEIISFILHCIVHCCLLKEEEKYEAHKKLLRLYKGL